MADGPAAEGLRVEVDDGRVALITFSRPPNNHIDLPLVDALASALEGLDEDERCRAVVLASDGKHFCAGADFSRRPPGAPIPRDERTGRTLYREAARLLRTRKPVVAAVQGAAVGAGLGLAAVADFRVACPEARFSANFTRLGMHPGFGLTATLPRIVGHQKAALMFYTGRRVPGEEAAAMGLADLLVPQAEVRGAALALAREIAGSAPLAVQGVRDTLRRGLADAYVAATEREFEQQSWQRTTGDFAEGVKAMAERREPRFSGR